MTRFRTPLFCGLMITVLLSLGVVFTSAQAPAFSSLYTNLKTGCKPAIKLKRGEQPQGDDMPLRCNGYGGYEVRIDYSAASSELRIQPVANASTLKDDEAIALGSQPLSYNLTHKIEWRMTKGKPFAVIYRVDKSKSDQPEEMWSPENKLGESLRIKGLKGFEHIDFEIDAKTPGANVKAREMADQAYARK